MKFKQTEVGMIPSDWECVSFNKVFVKLKSRNHQINSDEYLIIGKYPVVDQGQEPIVAYTNKNNPMEVPSSGLIVFGDHTRIFKYVDFDFFVGADGTQLITCLEGLNTKFLFYQCLCLDIPNTGYNRHFKYLKESLFVIPSSKEEQQRIANALSDVDTLINNLEKLIAKKKNIKQGAMQQLLTGKKRLPGFAPAKPTYKQTELGMIPTDWEVKSVGKLLKIGHGRDYKNLKSGNVPVYGTGGYMTSVNDYLYEGEIVCIGRKGTIDKPFYHTGKIWTVDTLFYTYGFNGCIPKFIYYAFCLVDWLAMNEASGVPSLTSKNIEDVLLRIPPSKAEQTAIANVLSDMDTEIATLETKLAKYRKLKTGMMQQLLTGKIRLV